MFKFPDKENPNMTDRQWETYSILTELKYMNDAEKLLTELSINYPNQLYDTPIVFGVTSMRSAQDIIWFLLKETGRLDEWGLFKEKEEDDKNTI